MRNPISGRPRLSACRGALALLVLLPLSSRAATDADPVGQSILRLFERVSAIPRPSGQEEGVRKLIAELIASAPAAWKQGIEQRLDGQGNLFVTLPATGRFAAEPLPSVILQSHMDMVLAVRSVPEGSDLAGHFANGVSLQSENGWIYSREKRTTLGADDGIGIAIALRYLVDPALEHPPLILMFTVCEETTTPACREIFKRAPEVEVPAGAPVLINLDAGSADTVVYGCLGHRKGIATTKLPTVGVPADFVFLRLAVTDLKGGHSGGDIHRPRLNPVHAAAALLDELVTTFPRLLLLHARSGGKTRMNAIQSAAELVVAVPAAQADAVSRRALSKLRALVASRADEDLSRSKLTAEPTKPAAAAPRGLDGKQVRRIAKAVLSIRHGIVVAGAEPPYPNGLRASTNVGWLELEPDGGGPELAVTVGFYVRAFEQKELERIVAENLAKLKRLHRSPSRVALTPISGGAPWLADTGSWLFRLVGKELPRFKLGLAAGGLDVRDYARKAPTVQMMAMAPTMRNAHSPDEALEIASVGPVASALQTLLSAVGDSPEFRKGVPAAAPSPTPR